MMTAVSCDDEKFSWNLFRGERIDERFTDDNEFWRYTGKIGNPYGDPLYEVV